MSATHWYSRRHVPTRFLKTASPDAAAAAAAAGGGTPSLNIS